MANSHFLAIPFNARSPDGAVVVANFLLSPEAQARKAKVSVWGDPTVLDLAALSPSDRQLFDERSGTATVSAAGLVVPEPHPSWAAELARAWLARYGVQ